MKKLKIDLFKAIREIGSSGKLTGAELEMHQEGITYYERNNTGILPGSIIIPPTFFGLKKRAYLEVDTTAGAGFIPTIVGSEVNVNATPNLLEKLGVTVFDGLIGNLKLPRVGELSAAFVGEKAAVDTGGTSPDSILLQPRRVGSGENFSKELFIQVSPSLQNSLFAKFLDAIWRAIQKDLFAVVANEATVITGYAITDTVAALTHAAILDMESGIKPSDFGMAYVMSPGQRTKLKALELGSNGSKFAWENNMVNDFAAYASNSIAATNGGSTNTAFDVLFGAWQHAVVGLWESIEIIVDPATAAKTGEYVITVNALADTAIVNNLSFSAIRNADI